MIEDLVNFGSWLNDNDLDGFGEGSVRGNDYVVEINFDNDEFSITNISLRANYNFHFNSGSVFNNALYFNSSQNIMIPSNSSLAGLTPFVTKIGNTPTDFNKFKDKVKRSLNDNSNNKSFINVLDIIFSDFENNYLNKLILNENEFKLLVKFLNQCNIDDLKKIILRYYDFLNNNIDSLIDFINDFKDSDMYINKPKPNFYLVCVFEDNYDYLNDLFYHYSKFIKPRSKNIVDFDEGICSICGSKGLTYPSIECFGFIDDTSFNYTATLDNSKLKLCKLCNAKMNFANDKLKNILNTNDLMIIPKCRDNIDFTPFLKIANIETNSFDKINRFLKENNELYEYDLVIYKKENSIISIKKYISNYKAFLIRFKDLRLYDEGTLKYLFGEHFTIKDEDNYKNNIENFFELEPIFKKFFYDLGDNGNYKFPNFNHFYQIYLKDTRDIMKGFDSNLTSNFVTYKYNIFSFIYELNLNAINKEILNRIALTSIMKFEKNFTKINNYKHNIRERLNYYFMLKKKFIGDNMLSNENVKSLKCIFGSKDFDKNNPKLDEIIEKDPACKYYLLGQFIKHIDTLKRMDNKKPVVFNNFITNANYNNIRDLFVSEILQKNNYYIEKMNKKAKYVFSIFEKDLDSLFNEDDYNFEDYVLLIFTGNYTENILSSTYKNEEIKNE